MEGDAEQFEGKCKFFSSFGEVSSVVVWEEAHLASTRAFEEPLQLILESAGQQLMSIMATPRPGGQCLVNVFTCVFDVMSIMSIILCQ